MAWSPLAGGALFDTANKSLLEALAKVAERLESDVTSVAVAWLLAHPARILPVMGTNNLERIAAFSKATSLSTARHGTKYTQLHSVRMCHEQENRLCRAVNPKCQ